MNTEGLDNLSIHDLKKDKLYFETMCNNAIGKDKNDGTDLKSEKNHIRSVKDEITDDETGSKIHKVTEDKFSESNDDLQKKYNELLKSYKQQTRFNLSLQAEQGMVLDSHGSLINEHLQLLMANFEEKFHPGNIQKCLKPSLENENKTLIEQLTQQKADHKELVLKHENLTNKIMEHLECPVCFDVPKTGPIPVCQNGHFVCTKCKRDLCPTCRVRLQEGKSLLAANLLDLIPHKCVFEDCQETIYLNVYKNHLKDCPHRLLKCPASSCTAKISFSKLIDHILNYCNESFSDLKHCGVLTKFPIHLKMSFYKDAFIKTLKMSTFLFDDQYFFLNCARIDNKFNMTVHKLGKDPDCSQYGFSITVCKVGDREFKGKHVLRFSGEPFSMEDSAEEDSCGLLVDDRVMNKIYTVFDQTCVFSVAIELKKS